MVGQTVLAACALWLGSAGMSEANEPSDRPTAKAWKIAPEVSYYRYREPGLMRNEGTLYGITGSYTFRNHRDESLAAIDANDDAPTSWSTVRLEGRFASGDVDYDGSYMDGTPLSQSGIDDFLIDVRLLWGRQWRPARFFDAMHLGLGYRYLNDDSSSKPGGYERESNYLYVPLGSRKDFRLTSHWDLALTGEVDVLLIGRQIAHLSDADADLPDVRNWQWPGFGAGVSFDFVRKGHKLDFGFSPFVHYWWVAESGTSEGYFEPENNTFEYGLSLVVRF